MRIPEKKIVRKSLLAFSLSALAAGLLLPSGSAQDEGAAAVTPEQAGKEFRATCVDCHTVPDGSYKTDGAWVSRLKDTA